MSVSGVAALIPLDRPAPRISRPPGRILGDSASMRQVLDLIDRLAASDATVLITGESGSGKELVARAIHDRSPRRQEPFVAINCAALPATLLESELFGHVRGAFTDAKRSYQGLLAAAGEGTIFLDEIGEMPLEMQAKLLRVVEERVVRPIGSDLEVPIQARILTATNRQIEPEVEAGRFRHDLYYRISVVDLVVPPLRARGDDVALLARHFLDHHAARLGRPRLELSESVLDSLRGYPWPGNVRELDNCMHRAVTLSRGTTVELDDLPARIRHHRGGAAPGTVEQKKDVPVEAEELLGLDELQRRHVRKVLASLGGNRSQTARVLGVSRRTFYRLAERLGVLGGG